MTKVVTSERSYRSDIDGIRAIAISSVVLYHAGVPICSGGFSGVDIFFVISGYLIGGHIFSELRSGTFSFLSFYQRRAKRILPAFYVVLAFTIMASYFLLSPYENHLFALSAVSATLYVPNIFFLRYLNDYFNAGTSYHPLLMTWSLGVEEQFYAIIPLLMVLLTRIRRSLLLPAIITICILSFLLAWHQVSIHPSDAFYLLPERAWELGVGVALAVMEQTRRTISLPSLFTHLLGTAGFALMLAPIFVLNANMKFPGPAALPTVLGTALVIALPASWINRRLLSLPFLVFIGRISYSWYLWHWPLLCYLHIASCDNVPAYAAITAVVLSLAAAILSYYFIEQPFRHSRRAPGPLLLRYAMASAFMLVLSSVIWTSSKIPHFPQPFPLLAISDHEAVWSPESSICMPEQFEHTPSPACYNPADPRPSVAIWGDSHSLALAPGLRAIASEQGYGIVQFSGGMCAPLSGAALYNPLSPLDARKCIQFNRKTLNLLCNDSHVRIVFLVGMWTLDAKNGWVDSGSFHDREMLASDASNALFRRSLTNTIRDLHAAGKIVVVMGDVPFFSFDPMMKFRTAHIPARRALSVWMHTDVAEDTGAGSTRNEDQTAIINAQLRSMVDGFQGVQLVDLHSKFCHYNDECIYRIGDHLLFRDSNHLSPFGARYAMSDYHLPTLTHSTQ
jgi:peptidoglycan/LPS O-acetylase OafA/YrhL